MKIGDVKIEDGMILWGSYPWGTGVDYKYYIAYWPNWLPKKYRYWGRYDSWYDGPHCTFGFWFFNVSWSTPWDKFKG